MNFSPSRCWNRMSGFCSGPHDWISVQCKQKAPDAPSPVKKWKRVSIPSQITGSLRSLHNMQIHMHLKYKLRLWNMNIKTIKYYRKFKSLWSFKCRGKVCCFIYCDVFGANVYLLVSKRHILYFCIFFFKEVPGEKNFKLPVYVLCDTLLCSLFNHNLNKWVASSM